MVYFWTPITPASGTLFHAAAHHARARRRANRIRIQLGGESGLVSPLPSKPKGMHRRIHAQKLAELQAAEQLVLAWIVPQLKRIPVMLEKSYRSADRFRRRHQGGLR